MSGSYLSLLCPKTEQAYEIFLNNHDGALFNHSLKYRNFLKTILDASEDIYILAHQDSEIVGVLPAFIKRLPDGTSVINSLPFFGSHGGMLISRNAPNQGSIKKILLDKLLEIAAKEQAITLTIIDNPKNSESAFLQDYLKSEASDHRISQITDISILDKEKIEDELMEKFHYKTRNMVRKGLKGNFSIKRDESMSGFKSIYELHSQNMETVSGKAKPFSVFEAIYKTFEADTDYRIYIAEKEGEISAGLLVFYYKDFCEYFTPVINSKFRSEQPLSLLIYQAMQEAVSRGCKYWNWGGTWLTQDGVYLFKKRWGAEEKKYDYFCLAKNQNFSNYYEGLANSYFYLYPLHSHP